MNYPVYVRTNEPEEMLGSNGPSCLQDGVSALDAVVQFCKGVVEPDVTEIAVLDYSATESEARALRSGDAWEIIYRNGGRTDGIFWLDFNV